MMLRRLSSGELYDVKYDFAVDVIVALGLEEMFPTKIRGLDLYAEGPARFVRTIQAIAGGKRAHMQLEDESSNGAAAERILKEVFSKLAKP